MQSDNSMRSRLAIVVIALSLVASACGPTRPDQIDNAPLAKQAVTKELRGDLQGAGRSWEELAAMLDGADRDKALVRAAKAYQRAGTTADARRVIGEVGQAPPGEDGTDYLLLKADLSIAADEPRAAIAALEQLPDELPSGTRRRALELSSEAHFRAGQPGAGVAAAVELESYLPNTQSMDANRRRIWNRLGEAAAEGAVMTTPADANATVSGWMELGRLAEAAAGNSQVLRTSLSAWQAQNPNHPASRSVIDGLLASYGDLTSFPTRIALILPLSGRLQSSAAAVREGFLAAYYGQQATEERPSIAIYDSAALGPVGAWERAAQAGAEFIVGPLTKDEVEKIVGVSGGVTTLALNEPSDPGSMPVEMYRFALAPEDEARQVATRILADGHYRGLALVPATDWGMRIAASLGEALQAGGGRLVELATYSPGYADYSETITRALRVDSSKRRHANIEQRLGTTLKFEPRRRQDVDFVFVAALPRDGRLLKPQLRFHRAADLPVYATSSIFEQRESGNRDLDGLTFDDMPWVLGEDEDIRILRAHVEALWPGIGTRRGRLFALGYDAYQLIPLIRSDRSVLATGFEGLTGLLTLEEGRRIQRQLEWATIVRGEPSVSGTPGSR